jgi:type IV pilus assembly protein PilA
MKIGRSVPKRLFSAGFTLVEIMVVIAIIGILAAVAIPRFAAYRQTSYNTAALSDLRNVKTNLESFYQEHQHFP